MLARKIGLLVFVFIALLAAGWTAHLAVQETRYTRSHSIPEEDVTITHTYSLPNPPVFRSREYVKIIRHLERLDMERSP